VSVRDRRIRSLSAEEIAWTCPGSWLPFRTTDEVATDRDASSQRNAVAAIELGVSLRAPGYNIFAAGPPGTGRTTTVRRVLAREEQKGPVPSDLCYVYDFAEPRAPRCLRLPAGTGRKLQEGLRTAVERFRQGISSLRASGAHRRRREAVARKARDAQSRLINGFQKTVAEEGFALVEVNLGTFRRHDLAPVVGEEPVPIDDLDDRVEQGQLSAEEAARFRHRHPVLAARLSETTVEMRKLGRELDEALASADRDAARPLLGETLDELRGAVGFDAGEHEALDTYLASVEEFLLEIVPLLFAAGESLAAAGEEASADPLQALQVNVIVDRSGAVGRPVVEEAHPSPARLLGSLEIQRSPDGSVRADLGGLRPGALHRADGGFLLINAMDLINEDGAWMELRKALRTGLAGFRIGHPDDGPPPIAPEPAKVDVTVVLVGPPALRERLAAGDPEFNKLFKVVALFEERVPLTREVVASYSALLASVVQEEELRPLDAGAVARTIEHMVRLAGGRRKISTRLRWLADLAREASWFAGRDGASIVLADHVAQALAARRERAGLLSTRIQESIRTGIIHLEFEGLRAGQVNALAVVETNLERFGYPVRLTATSSVGHSGIIDIEREAELSGEIHTKASLILAGYLRSQFAQRAPLAVTASVCFEQSYGGVEGDSASCAELSALLSSLAGVPLRQDLALTGAVDQRGQVLAVGGVNEKVEGFWRVCRATGITGSQGVIIPQASMSALQVDREIVEDVEEGRFHVYAAADIGQVMELLTGVEFGSRQPDGSWPSETLGARIDARLHGMANDLRHFRGCDGSFS
jgi:predicted ATP-dependent protease